MSLINDKITFFDPLKAGFLLYFSNLSVARGEVERERGSLRELAVNNSISNLKQTPVT